MSNRYEPTLKPDISDRPTKKKYLRCLGCDVMGRRGMWKDLISELRNNKRYGKDIQSNLYFRVEESGNRSTESLHVHVEGPQLHGQMGYLTREDTSSVLSILKDGCEFRLDVADYNRVGEREIPLVMTYTLPAVEEPEPENPAALEPVGYEHDAVKVPFIKGYACEIPFARVEMINAERAKDMLTHNSRNRELKPKNVADIAESMRNHYFDFTCQSIGFDRKGILIDGQHRLHAIVQADVEIPMVVVYGCNQSPFLDRGGKRSVKDNLKICYGDEFTGKVIALINHIYRVYSGTHHSLSEVKTYLAYEKIRSTIEKPKFAATFLQPKAAFASRYTSALLILLLSGRFKDEDIEDMNSMFLYGMHVDGMRNRAQDHMIIEVRDDILTGKKPFIKKRGQDIELDVEQTMTCMRVMLPYLMDTKLRKSRAEVDTFCHSVLTKFFTELEELYKLPAQEDDPLKALKGNTESTGQLPPRKAG